MTQIDLKRPKMRADLLLKTVPVLAALLLGGCLSLGGKVPDTLFTLTAEKPVAAGPPCSANLRNGFSGCSHSSATSS